MRISGLESFCESIIMKWILGAFLFGLLWIDSSAVECGQSATDTESRIKHDVICEKKYDMTHKDKNTTQVASNFIIRSFDFDDEGILKLTLWVVMKWTDARLKWNPTSYENMEEIYEETLFLWTPELNLYNEEIDVSNSNCGKTTCIVNSKGEVRCVFPCIYNGQCDADYRDWPYDRQTCSLMFGAWIHPGEHLNFTTKATTLKTEHAATNFDWKIIGSWVERIDAKYNNTKNATYPSLHYAFFLERHSSTFTAIVTVPALLCATANLIALMLDVFSTERFVLICVNILVHLLHLQTLMYSAPHNGDTAPRIVVFGRDSLFMTGFLAIMTILLRAMNRYRGDMPNWLTSLHNTLSNAQIYRFLLVNGAPAASVTSSSGNQIEKIEQQQPDDDGAVLVEMRKSETAYASTESLWPTIALFIDRIVLIVFVCAYLALILTWLPSEVSRKDAMQALGIEDK